jgi:hypothetical protein
MCVPPPGWFVDAKPSQVCQPPSTRPGTRSYALELVERGKIDYFATLPSRLATADRRTRDGRFLFLADPVVILLEELGLPYTARHPRRDARNLIGPDERML